MESTELYKRLASLLGYKKAYDILKENMLGGMFSLQLRQEHESYKQSVEEELAKIPISLHDRLKNVLLKQSSAEEKYILDDDEIRINLMLPVILNISFLNEIALKTLILLNNKNKVNRVHTLSDLFNLLESEQKDRIKQIVDKTDTEFATLLETNKEHFPKWRYYYEQDMIGRNKPDLDFLEKLYEGIEKEIMKLVDVPQ